MREHVAAPQHNAPAPQAPARSNTPSNKPSDKPDYLNTFNSHRKIRGKIGDKKLYRPVRLHTLSRIDEAPLQTRPPTPRNSVDISSNRPILRSRSNVSADTSRSVPVCNDSHVIGNQIECSSPQYAELGSAPGSDTGSSYERPASMTDMPVMIPLDPATDAYYPPYTYYRDDGRLNKRKLKKRLKKLSSKHSNLYLAFMY
ncbi:unnamed protein product [Diatraea saccharalis]|uniref:Uncharacterized protein n=1 Tax=Diatraea saccharalis TaxID=40085 RepID=A0A9N9QZA0_9NEOP|nr:unnamed protein product [Diatraea saccharalis]